MSLTSSVLEVWLALFAASIGSAATVTSIHNDTLWGTVAGASVGAAGVAWVVGYKIRDKMFEFLRKQNEEMSIELDKAARAALEARQETVRVAEALATKTAKDLEGIHEQGSDTKKLIAALEIRLDHVVMERDHLVKRNDGMFDQLTKCHENLNAVIPRLEALIADSRSNTQEKTNEHHAEHGFRADRQSTPEGTDHGGFGSSGGEDRSYTAATDGVRAAAGRGEGAIQRGDASSRASP